MFSFLNSPDAPEAKSQKQIVKVQNKTHRDVSAPPINGRHLPEGFGEVKGWTAPAGKLVSIDARYFEAVSYLAEQGKCKGLVKGIAAYFSLPVDCGLEPQSPVMATMLEFVDTDDARYSKPDGSVEPPANLRRYNTDNAVVIVQNVDELDVLKRWHATETREEVKEAIENQIKELGGKP